MMIDWSWKSKKNLCQGLLYFDPWKPKQGIVRGGYVEMIGSHRWTLCPKMNFLRPEAMASIRMMFTTAVSASTKRTAEIQAIQSAELCAVFLRKAVHSGSKSPKRMNMFVKMPRYSQTLSGS